MKPICLSRSQWHELKTILAKEYQHTPSVMLIRSKMKDVLGFTVREHRQWIEYSSDSDKDSTLLTTIDLDRGGYSRTYIMLDFFSEPMRTMFLLKYSHIINES
jgi:hypothetical protein